MKKAFIFCFLAFNTLTYAQWSILSIKDIDSVRKNEAELNDIIKVELSMNGSKQKMIDPIYLYLNGKVFEKIKAFGIDSSSVPNKLYFQLDEEKLAPQIDIKNGRNYYKLDVGSDSEKYTKATVENFSLIFTEKLITFQDYLPLYEPLVIEIHDYLSFAKLPKKEDIRLYLGGQLQMKAAVLGVTAGNPATITFKVDGTEATKKFYRQSSVDTVSIGIGSAEKMLLSAEKNLAIVFAKPYRWALDVIVFTLLFGLIFWLSWKEHLIRDNVIIDGRRPFSYSRTQLAFWTYVILTSFFYIWNTTKSIPIFPNSALVLLGLSVTVTAAGRLIDDVKPSQNGIAEQKKQAKQKHPFKRFFLELLSDGSGVSIHRFQNFVFTLFLGIVFWWEVFKHLEMPSFNIELLALMGISSAAYAGIKAWEGR